MKLKHIIISGILLLSLKVNAQKEYQHAGIYTTVGYEIGFLSSDIQKTTQPFTSSVIEGNLNHSLAITGIYKTSINAEIKLGYMASYSSLAVEGVNVDKPFAVDNNYFAHTVFIGAGYNFPIKNDVDITLGLGSAISYIKNADVTEEQGSIADKIVATNSSINNGNVYLIPELSITKYLKNGNTVTFGGKYYYSANDNFIEGTVKNVSNGTTLRQVNYTTQNNQIAIYLNYGFNLSKLF